MTMHISLKLRGLTLWGCAVLAILGLASLWIEVARGASAIWEASGVDGWRGFVGSAVSMAILFFVVSTIGRRSYDRVTSVTGSLASQLDFFIYLDRPSLWFWAVSSACCAGCLVVQIVRVSTHVAAWLGVGWSGRIWLLIGALPCAFLLTYLALHWLAARMAVRFDVVRRPAANSPAHRGR
jgi:hypothetical protein